MANGKARNAFADDHRGEGINAAPLQEQHLPDMVCPEVPIFHDKNNFWESSCELKQQMSEHYMTCFPHCKGGRNRKVYRYNNDGKIADHSKRTEYAEGISKRIVDLYNEGNTIKEIAEKISRSKALVQLRLNEAGIVFSKKRKSKKVECFKDWMEDPSRPDRYMVEKYGLEPRTVNYYRRDFKRSYPHLFKRDPNSLRERVLNWLDDNPEATTSQVTDQFNCHPSTACAYRRTFRNSGRYLKATK